MSSAITQNQYRVSNKFNTEPDTAVVMNVDSGQIVFSRNPDAPYPFASCIKVIIADLVNKKLDQMSPEAINLNLRATKQIQAEDEPITQLTVKDALIAMLKRSSNTATNMLIKFLGGPEAVTKIARQFGFSNTNIKYLSLPGVQACSTADPNCAYTSADNLANGMRIFYNNQNSLSAVEKEALKNPEPEDRLDYNGRVMQKIGFTSKTMADVGVIKKNGNTYVIVSRFSADGSDSNSRKALSAFNNRIYDKL